MYNIKHHTINLYICEERHLINYTNVTQIIFINSKSGNKILYY